MRKGAIIIIVLLLAAAASLAYVLQQKRVAIASSPFSAIPLDAGVVLEAVSMQELCKSLVIESNFFNEMKEINSLSKFTNGIQIIDSLSHSSKLTHLFATSSVLVSFHHLGKHRVEGLYVLSLAPGVKVKHIREQIHTSDHLIYGERVYQGKVLFEINSKLNKSLQVYLAYVDGILVVSKSNILVEAAIRQSGMPNDIRSLQGFKEVASAANKNDTKLFFVFDNLPKLISKLSASKEGIFGDPIGSLASSSEADLFLKKNSIIMSGFIEASDSSKTLSKYLAYAPNSFESYSIIPSNVAMFESAMGAESITVDAKAVKAKEPSAKAINSLAEVIDNQLDGEVVKLYFNHSSKTPTGSKMAIYKLKGQKATEDVFRDRLKEFYQTTNANKKSYVINYKPDDQSSFTIFRLPNSNITAYLASGFASSYKLNYATFFEGYFVVGESSVALSKFIYDNILKKTLANDFAFREFENTLPSRSVYYFYCVPSEIINVLSEHLSKELVKALEVNISHIKKISALGFKLSPSNGMLYSTLSVNMIDKPKQEASTQWESLLDTVISSKPMFFTNHNTGKNEIFVQDLKNNIYLINSAGRVLWKIQLKEQISGNPKIIDYYRNSKLQILFSTKNMLHLLDRNGNYVERYPVTLRATATNSLAVFDYDKTKEYRLFICGTDKVLYLYDKSGNTVKGWNQYRTTSAVKSEVEYFRVSGKDYIIVNDSDNMYILNRKGQQRASVKEPIARAQGSSLKLTSENTPRMVLSTDDGKLKFISFNGSVETVELAKFSSSHSFEYFDIDSDGLGEYIYIDEGKIFAFDDNFSKMFSKAVGSGKIFGPYGLTFSSNDKKIGYVNKKKGGVYLIDYKGKSLKGFPLNGNTSFSIGNILENSTYNLITGGNDSFIYNYEINR